MPKKPDQPRKPLRLTRRHPAKTGKTPAGSWPVRRATEPSTAAGSRPTGLDRNPRSPTSRQHESLRQATLVLNEYGELCAQPDRPVGNHTDPLPLVDGNDALQAGQQTVVFVWPGSQGRWQASSTHPRVFPGENRLLPVHSTSSAGAWLDWGLNQHLLLPWSETDQRTSLRLRQQQLTHVFVHVFVDPGTGRICASTRFHRHLPELLADSALVLRKHQTVHLQVAAESAVGFKVIVDQALIGLLYRNEVFQPLAPGDELEAHVKKIRDDGRVDLQLQGNPDALRASLAKRILQTLEENGGISTLTDQSPPEQIYARYQVSKKRYKQTLGTLYKARRIAIEPGRIRQLN